MLRAEGEWKDWAKYALGTAVAALLTGMATALGEEVVREVKARREKKAAAKAESNQWREYLASKEPRR